MYLNYFGLTEKPFSISPDPRFLYLSEKHRDGLAHLLYGADETGSFVLLTGEVGTGKTTLCRRMLMQAPEDVHFALILNPLQTPHELLASICDEFQIPYEQRNASRKQLIDTINHWLLKVHANGQRAVVVIDEAQNLNAETLEQIRLLTNLETSSEKLLKIILIGQPELKDILARPELRQLNQRITARYHLEPLSLDETRTYIKHRLKVAGATRDLFKPRAIKKLHRISEGIPRIMNLISDRALTGAYGQQKDMVDASLLQRAAEEVFNRPTRKHTPLPWILGSLLGLTLIAGGLYGWNAWRTAPHTAAATTLPETPNSGTTVQAASKETTPASVQPADQATAAPGESGQQSGHTIASPGKTAAAGDNAIEILSGAQIERHLTPEANTTSAFQSLFKLWGLDFADYNGAYACERARKAGMQCLYAEGKLSKVFDYNLPAVLELTSHGGQLNQITLVGRDDDQLIVDIAGKRYQIQQADLAAYWNGNYLLIWRSPPDGKPLVQPGAIGPSVVWLRRQLDLAEGIEQPQGQYSNFYDNELKQRIKQFQANHGLAADGIAGEKTLIKLQAATQRHGANVPVLTE